MAAVTMALLLLVLLVLVMVLVVLVPASPVQAAAVPDTACSVEAIPGQEDVHIAQLAGTWHEMARTTYAYGNATWTSSVWNLVQGHDGTVLAAFTGYSRDSGVCSPAMVGQLAETEVPGHFLLDMGNIRGTLIVVYHDGATALVYLCLGRPRQDGRCHRSQLFVYAWSRGLPLPLPLAGRHSGGLDLLLARACVQPEDVLPASPGLCPAPALPGKFARADLFRVSRSPLLAVTSLSGQEVTLPCAASRGRRRGVTWTDGRGQLLTYRNTRVVNDSRLSTRHSQPGHRNLHIAHARRTDRGLYRCFRGDNLVQRVILSVRPKANCLVESIPAVSEFDHSKASGEWYVTLTTADLTDVISDSRVLMADGSGHVVMVRSLYRDSTGTCLEPDVVRMTSSLTGRFRHEGSEGTSVLVHLDDSHALWYTCRHVTTEGTCRQGQGRVDVLSRHPHPSSSDAAVVENYVTDLCVDASDLRPAVPGICFVPRTLLLEMEMKMEFAHQAAQRCQVRNVSPPAGLDLKQMEGVWYPVMTTATSSETGRPQGQGPQYFLPGEHGLAVTFSSFNENRGSCEPVKTQEMEQLGRPGEFQFNHSGETAVYKVLLLEGGVAAVYTCLEVTTSGLCREGSLRLEILSSVPEVSSCALTKVKAAAGKACIDVNSLTVVPRVVCEDLPDTFRTADATKKLSQGDESINNFAINQMSGLWFEVARTRFTFNTLESGIHHFTFSPDQARLHSLSTGTLQGVCQVPLHSELRRGSTRGDDSSLQGRIVGLDRKFPWFQLRVIHFDPHYVMTAACYEDAKGGDCPRDKTEVTLLGRQRHLDEAMQRKLPGLMGRLGLNGSHLHRTKEEADCMPVIINGDSVFPDVELCRVGDVPVVEGLQEDSLLGTWYGQVATDFSSPGGATLPAFTLTFSRLTPTSLDLVLAQRQNETCKVTARSRVKAKCGSAARGDYLTTFGAARDGQWTHLKVLHLDREAMLLYWCTRLEDAGTCNPNGLKVTLVSRSRSLPKVKRHEVLRKASRVCLRPEELSDVTVGAECRVFDVTPPVPASPCAVDSLQAVPIEPHKFGGLWYEVARTVDRMFSLEAAAVYYLPVPHPGGGGSSLKLFFSGKTPDGKCLGPLVGDLQPRCQGDRGGHYLGRLKMPGRWSWTGWLVLYTDYTEVAVAASCTEELADGSCRPAGVKMHLLSRTLTLDPERRRTAEQHIRKACLDPRRLVDTRNDGQCGSHIEERLEAASPHSSP